MNGFIADKQAILYDGDDAFHGKTGYDALEAAPAVNERLLDLRQSALDSAWLLATSRRIKGKAAGYGPAPDRSYRDRLRSNAL